MQKDKGWRADAAGQLGGLQYFLRLKEQQLKEVRLELEETQRARDDAEQAMSYADLEAGRQREEMERRLQGQVDEQRRQLETLLSAAQEANSRNRDLEQQALRHRLKEEAQQAADDATMAQMGRHVSDLPMSPPRSLAGPSGRREGGALTFVRVRRPA